MPEERRTATLLAFARTLEAGAQDDVLDLFDVVVAKLFADPASVGKRARLRTIRDLDAAALRLHHVDGGRISGQRGGARAGHREEMLSTGRCRTFDLPTRFTPQYLNDRKNLERVRELAASAKVRGLWSHHGQGGRYTDEWRSPGQPHRPRRLRLRLRR
jgi:hypothetical protein